MVNNRLNDCFDLELMVEREALDAATLALVIAATFQRRGTGLPAALPVGLSDEFASDVTRMALWHALLKKNASVHWPLMDVVAAPMSTRCAGKAKPARPARPATSQRGTQPLQRAQGRDAACRAEGSDHGVQRVAPRTILWCRAYRQLV